MKTSVRYNRLVLFFFLILVILLVINIFKSKNYSISYNVDGYDINQTYNHSKKYYMFEIKNKKYSFDFTTSYKRTKKKLINKLEMKDDCLSISIIEKKNITTLCKNEKTHYNFLAKKENKEKSINKVDNIDIYNDKHDYYVWNGYGITSINSRVKYNFFDVEHYSNNLSFKNDRYILFADYDNDHSFSKLYVFDSLKKKKFSIDFDYEISFDSYFNGEYDNYVYLFDRKNKTQYKININKKKVSLSSDGVSAFFYENEERKVPLKKMIYTDYIFSGADLINYKLVDDRLYYSYYSFSTDYLCTSKKVDYLLSSNKENAVYMINDSVYMFDQDKGSIKLLQSFEWNFDYHNKIFVF